MISLSAKIRKETGRKVGALLDAGRIPAVVYGPGEKNASIDVDYQEFRKVLHEAGESSLVELDVEGEKAKRLVLIHEIQRNPVEDTFIHIDFFQANLKEETEAEVPLVFEGEAAAVKDLGGTLVKNMSEIEVKALPQNLPHEIKVSIESLKTFEDRILVKDLILPKDVKATANPEEIVASVLAQADVEEELTTPIEEKVEEVEKVEKEKKEEVVIEEEK
jgi:large subunit ribosomal protein L25